MTIETTTITAPAYWLCAFVYGDLDGFDDSEIAAFESFCESLGDWQIVDVASDDDGEPCEARFTWSYALHGGTACGGDVLDYVAHRYVAALAA